MDRAALLEEQKELRESLAKQNDRVNSLKKTAFQLANYYFGSQAVVFTALTLNTSLKCQDVWFPLVLSVVPAILNLIAFGTIGKSYIEAIKYREQTAIMRETNQRNLENIQAGVINVVGQVNAPAGDSVEKVATRYLIGYMIAFASFGIVIVIGTIRILCK